MNKLSIVYLKEHNNVANAFLSELSLDGVLIAREVQITNFRNDLKEENKHGVRPLHYLEQLDQKESVRYKFTFVQEAV